MSRKPAALIAPRDAWQAAFPADEAQRAARFLAATWNEVSTRKPKAFRMTLRENQITETFGLYLKKLSLAQARLTGWWSHEDRHAELDESDEGDVKTVRRIRKDITYQSNATERLELVFEFKKLTATNSSCKTYRGVDGMRRFVDGNYAKDLPLAFMVGMVIGDMKDCRDTLHRSLVSPAGRSDLRMIPDAHGQLIVTPSKLFPSIAAFDTEHTRPAGWALPYGTMLLSHLFLSMPISPP